MLFLLLSACSGGLTQESLNELCNKLNQGEPLEQAATTEPLKQFVSEALVAAPNRKAFLLQEKAKEQDLVFNCPNSLTPEIHTFYALLSQTDTWTTTCAYWLGSNQKDLDLSLLNISEQYDIEEQADHYGYAVNKALNRIFEPIAPVQLTHGWSPMPLAINILGTPTQITTETDILGTKKVTAKWNSINASSFRQLTQEKPEETRFQNLLQATLSKSISNNKGITLVVKPGWSFGDNNNFSLEVAELMTKAGFVETSRY